MHVQVNNLHSRTFCTCSSTSTSLRTAGVCKRDKSGTTSKLNTKKTTICTRTSLLLGCARVELRTTTTKPVVDSSSSVKNGRGGQSQSLEAGRAGRWLSGSFHTLWMGPTHTKDQRLESSLTLVEREVLGREHIVESGHWWADS